MNDIKLEHLSGTDYRPFSSVTTFYDFSDGLLDVCDDGMVRVYGKSVS